MVPTPKNRTAVTLSAVLLVAVAGAYWLWSGTRDRQVTPLEPQGTSLTEEPAEGAGTAVTPVTTSPETGSTAPEAPAQSEALPATVLVPESYVTVKGDTLESIAERFYQDSRYFGDIEAMNADVLTDQDADSLPSGVTLKLPKREDLPALAAPKAQAASGTSSTATDSATTSAAGADTTTTSQTEPAQ